MIELLRLIWNEHLRWRCRRCKHTEGHHWWCSNASRQELREYIAWLNERIRENEKTFQIVFQRSQDRAKKIETLIHENNKLRKANERLRKESGE